MTEGNVYIPLLEIMRCSKLCTETGVYRGHFIAFVHFTEAIEKDAFICIRTMTAGLAILRDNVSRRFYKLNSSQ